MKFMIDLVMIIIIFEQSEMSQYLTSKAKEQEIYLIIGREYER
ncbi:hypothetical protein JCM16161A_10980 [Vulcanisaeta sp. JCM 16161]